MIDSRTSTTTVSAGSSHGSSYIFGSPYLASSGPSSPRTPSRQVDALYQRLQSIVTASESLDQLLSQLVRLTLEQSGCQAVFLAERDESSQFRKIKLLPGAKFCVEPSSLSHEFSPLVQAVHQSGSLQSHFFASDASRQLVAVPLRLKADPEAPFDLILIGNFEAGNSSSCEPTWLMASNAYCVTQFILSKKVKKDQADLGQWSERWKLTNNLIQAGNPGEAFRLVVNHLRRIVKVAQVSLTVDEKLVAISDVEQIDRQNESLQVAEAACNASLRAAQPVEYSLDLEQVDAEQRPLQVFCHVFRFNTCISFPLVPTGSSRRRIALLMAGDPQQLSAGNRDRLRQILEPIGNQLNVLLKGHRSISAIVGERLAKLVNHRWRKIFVISLLALTVALAIPLPYRIKCNCEIQPVMRRFIVAPFESVLERTLVKNGDVVQKNQLIAQLDGRLLRIELSGLEAELVGAKKRYDTELAGGNVAQSQIAKSEVDRLKARIGVLQNRFNELEIRSPIDGVIINGDLEKVQGASLTIGQALFEIAPLDEMIVEIAIPETEIGNANSQMNVAVKLNACPFETWEGKVDSIHPRAELIENNSAFVAQSRIFNKDGILRPGMKGKAKIASHWRPVAWILFHRPCEALQHYTVW